MTTFDLATTDALLSTTRAVRKRLDMERPVERSVIMDCIGLSQQAPTGSNKQGWRWVVVTDSDKRKVIADYYRKGVGDYLVTAKAAAEDRGASQDARVFDSAQFLADRMQDAPVHVIPCIEAGHIPDDAPPRAWIGLGGSIFPAIWSFQLALRARGLGSCLTTLHLSYDKEVSELLGIPDTTLQIALLPVAYTKGTDFKPAKRPPAEEITHWESW
ncbi:MAG: nitroreductase family protein [Rhodospirillaceae bacterium]|nr:nitroreductase family protein [Rhodospirillaceae bacterium]